MNDGTISLGDLRFPEQNHLFVIYKKMIHRVTPKIYHLTAENELPEPYPIAPLKLTEILTGRFAIHPRRELDVGLVSFHRISLQVTLQGTSHHTGSDVRVVHVPARGDRDIT